MKSKGLYIILFCCTLNLYGQNLFPVKLDNCKTDNFCLDCGDVKASYDNMKFLELEKRINKGLNLNGVEGSVKFQVLIDSKGHGCVLSHNNKSNDPITLKIIKELNDFKDWIPAKTEGKVLEKVSVNLVFTAKSGAITGNIERVDIEAFGKSFDRPTPPEIFNKDYTYKNEHLKDYNVTVWNTKNSKLADNMLNHIAIDKMGKLWIVVDKGLQVFDGNNFESIEINSLSTVKESYFALEVSNDNTVWVDGIKNIYSFKTLWQKREEAETGIKDAYDIVNNPQTNELYFCSDKGLIIHSEGNWKILNMKNVKELPSDRVYYAKKDSKGRIWIGTFSGSIMIDTDGKITSFEKVKTILKGKCITSMDEDENGNLYFSLFEFDRKDKKSVNNDEGIAIYYTDGTFRQFKSDNSGMPFNHANCVLYDKRDKVLWISTDRAGLVRFDLKNGWENYHNENSLIPTSYISTMKLDAMGNLFLATRQGIVKIERR